MDQDLIYQMKGKLEASARELTDRLKSFAKPDAHVKGDFHSNFPEYGDKEEDNATEVAAYQDSLSLENDLEKDLKDVNEALEKIKNGRYGPCEKCGQEIDLKRLEVEPMAKKCMKCKDL